MNDLLVVFRSMGERMGWMDGVLMLALCIAVYTDLRVQKIRNWTTFPLILFGVIGNAYLGGSSGFAFGGLGFLMGFGLFLPVYLVGGVGPGDVKLFAGVGAVKGWLFAFTAWLGACIFGALMAVAWLFFKGDGWKQVRFTLNSLLTGTFMVQRLEKVSEKQKYPYALAIFAGVLAAYVWIHGLGRT